MSYYFNKIIDCSFPQAIDRTTEELKKEGFGIISEINVSDTFKKKLDVDFRNYKILGACSPKHAYKALQSEDKIGTMLPCNVIVQELSENRIEIAAVDPIASMMSIENQSLADIANEVREALQRVITSL